MTRKGFDDQLQKELKADKELLVKEVHKTLGFMLAIMLSLWFGDKVIILVLSPLALLGEYSLGFFQKLMLLLPESLIEGLLGNKLYLWLGICIIFVFTIYRCLFLYVWLDTRKKQLTEKDKEDLEKA